MIDRQSASRKVAIIGGGVIGGGWAARFLLNGWDVCIFDSDPNAKKRVGEVLDNARASLPALSDMAMPSEGSLQWSGTVSEAVAEASWIQESVPEDIAIKRIVFREIQATASSEAIIASSTSGFKPSELQQGSVNAAQIIVAHPFNPVYLLPLVELVCATNPQTRDRAATILPELGMKPLIVRKEIDAHIADRFLESVWREALWMIKDDVATTEEIDDAIRFGFGLRWAQMGMFETYRLAGGENGMRHFIRQFGPALQWPWSRLTDVPEMTDDLVDKIAEQSDAQSGRYALHELERVRDRNLVGILRALKERDWGAGALLNSQDRRLAQEFGANDKEESPLRLLDVVVLAGWIDYNGHMTDFRYAQVFSQAADALLRRVGLSDDYLAGGHSIFTAETRTLYQAQASRDELLYCDGQVLAGDAKRFRVFFCLRNGNGDLVATAESMFLHVDTASGRACDALSPVRENITALISAHEDLEIPNTAGRTVGQSLRS